MVNDKMIVSAGKAGDLLVRVAADRHETLLSEPGAEQAQMGTGRVMRPGWITVAPEAIADGTRLAFWVDVAMRHNRTVTGSHSGSKKPREQGRPPRTDSNLVRARPDEHIWRHLRDQ